MLHTEGDMMWPPVGFLCNQQRWSYAAGWHEVLAPAFAGLHQEHMRCFVTAGCRIPQYECNIAKFQNCQLHGMLVL